MRSVSHSAKMSLKCQKDSYLRSYRSRVASCRPAEPVGKGEGKYEVVLDDTVLFPEGGGQVNFTEKVSCCKIFPILSLYTPAV